MTPSIIQTSRAVLFRGLRLRRGSQPPAPTPAELMTVDQLGMFAPGSYGSPSLLAEVGIAAANQTVPLLASLGRKLGRGGLREYSTSSDFLRDSDRSAEAMADRLETLFTSYGSDKSVDHDYHRIYGRILTEANPIARLLEIGIGSKDPAIVSHMPAGYVPGASLRVFRDICPDALVYGADIDSSVLLKEPRIETFAVDQTDVASLVSLAKAIEGQLDVVIDDGLHAPHANLGTLLFALDKLRVGGWLVVEDIVRSARPLWEVVSQLLMPEQECMLVHSKIRLVFVMRKLM